MSMVPLVDCWSDTTYPAGTISSVAWTPEAMWSSMMMSQDGERPRVASAPAICATRPCSGPEVKRS